jgi:hypothetical protein
LVRVRDISSKPNYVPDGTVSFYLLLATQLNMKTQRTQAGEDGAAVFEQLCSEVAIRYWGGPGPNVCSIVFGTGRITEELKDHDELHAGEFRSAVNRLCGELREGFGFHAVSDSRVTARDGKLDVVVWRRFADGRPGQLIGFGQCKTGTHWQNDLSKLQPEAFCGKWMLKRPGVVPIRLYFVADRVVDRWYENSVDAGILFDRCRIVEYSDKLSPALTKRIRRWVTAAAASEALNLP